MQSRSDKDMTEQLSDAQKQVITQIECLRIEKEHLKQEIITLQNNIMNIDIQIRDLRQSLPSLAPVKEVKPRKHIETDEEKLARLTEETDTLRKQLEAKRHRLQ
jgi:hypothetical protein